MKNSILIFGLLSIALFSCKKENTPKANTPTNATPPAPSYTITTIAGNGYSSQAPYGGYSGDGGMATLAELNYPADIVIDKNGNLYIADTYNNRIRKVDVSGIITTIAGNGSRGYSGDGGAAMVAELNSPTGVAVDQSGNIYVADISNSCVRMVNNNGIITTIAGNGTLGYSGDGGAAISAELGSPIAVAVDALGNIYIADYSESTIRKVNTSGIISTIAGNGTWGYSGDGGQATSAEISDPTGIAVDGSKNVYIADYANNRIRKIGINGVINTVVGNGVIGFSGDGNAATSAEISGGGSLTVDALGNIYISDADNYRIRFVNTAGTIFTIAGTGIKGYSGDGGSATSAEINVSDGITIDASGNVYFADSGNQRIRKLSK